MSVRYSLIVPYFRTPEITRFSLHSIFKFCRGNAEVVVVNNDPNDPGSRMLAEFPRIKLVNNPTPARGSLANFEALDLGLRHASRDLVGLLHSDTIFLKEGWDLEWFGRLESENLAALGTFEREANPFRPWRKKIRDHWNHLRHDTRPAVSMGKLMLFWLLTRKSTLQKLDFNFVREGHLTSQRLADQHNGMEVLSCRQISRFMWHTSDVTSVVTGQMNDPASIKSFNAKRQQFINHPLIRKHFSEVLGGRGIG